VLVVDLINENEPAYKLLCHEGAFVRLARALKVLKAAREKLDSPTDAHPAPPAVAEDTKVQKPTSKGNPKNATHDVAPGRTGRRRPIAEGGGVCTTYGVCRPRANAVDDALARANALLARAFSAPAKKATRRRGAA
jgi:hypothetical protein